jgi:hypothetical protein
MFIIREQRSLKEERVLSYEDMTDALLQMLRDNLIVFNQIQIQLRDGDNLLISNTFELGSFSQLHGSSLTVVSSDKKTVLDIFNRTSSLIKKIVVTGDRLTIYRSVGIYSLRFANNGLARRYFGV